MKVSILGSRDQLCVNQTVMEAPTSRDKINMCQVNNKHPKAIQVEYLEIPVDSLKPKYLFYFV